MNRQSIPARARALGVLFLAATLVAVTSAFTPASNTLNGTWVGELVTDQFRASMTVKIAVDEQKASIDNRVEASPDRVAEGPATDVKVAKDSVEFTSDIGGADVRFSGIARGDTLSGSAVAKRNGQVVGMGTWSVVRKATQ